MSAIQVSCILCLVCRYFWIQSLPYECLVFSVLFASSFGFSLCYMSLVFSVLSASSFGFSLCHTSVLYFLSTLPVPLDSVSVVRVSCILCLLCQHIWIQSLPYVNECPVFSFFFASSFGFSLCHTYTNVLYSLSTLPVPLDSVSAIRVVLYSYLPVPLDSVSVLFGSTSGFSLCRTSLVFSVFFASTFGFSLCHTSVVSASARLNDRLFEI